MSFVVEEARSNRDLDALRQLYVDVLDAGPKVLPSRLSQTDQSQWLVAVPVRGRGILGGLSLNRDHDAVAQLSRGWGPGSAMQWATEYPLISHFAVHPDHQGRGVGAELLRRALTLARNRGGLQVWGFAEEHDGRPSAPFYERHGFTIHDGAAGGLTVGGVEHRSSVERVGDYFTYEL